MSTHKVIAIGIFYCIKKVWGGKGGKEEFAAIFLEFFYLVMI